MKSDLFILIPCHIDKGINFSDIISGQDDKYSQEYIENLKDISDSELVDRVSKTFSRKFLGEYKIPIYSDLGKDNGELASVNAKMFFTYCDKNYLGVITLVLLDYQGNISQVIDQVAREELYIKDINISDFLYNEYKIIKNGEAKMILTQPEKNSDEILYYMATETSQSELVKTNIISEKYKTFSKNNIAVYDFSDIYASESLVYQVLTVKENKLQYQGLLIFIVEILVMQLSAIYRTNNKVTKALEENQKIKVKEYESFSNEFANTLSIWQVDIYRYKGAQTIADKIKKSFGILDVLNNYKQNDVFLQNIINTSNVKNSMFESWILFIIAIVLFFKELYLIVKNIISSIVNQTAFSNLDIISSISSTSIIIILVIIVYFIRKIKLEN